MQRRSTQGVVFVHACPKALCQHVEWALERVIGAPVTLSWAEQPAAHGSYRAEIAWTGGTGTGSKLAAALKAWPMLRFEVTEDASQGNDGERLAYVPGQGIFRAPVSANGDLVVTEQQLRHLAATATSPEGFRHGVDQLLGAAWDDDLETYRHAGDGGPVTWLHQVV
ncbi:DUF3145 domain-containing protein [Modestobacter sp. Leaf380]|uniref:DUF3145 domain-containing protein n=1 Tax=Modestobacter sp. Leaf380 TaxID=1736356 RepID=UPI0006FBB575|nr:hypothetical protein ASG41_13130 [Modestobacter sp. Leaf380]